MRIDETHRAWSSAAGRRLVAGAMSGSASFKMSSYLRPVGIGGSDGGRVGVRGGKRYGIEEQFVATGDHTEPIASTYRTG